MIWETSWKADPRAREVADRHYNRQNPELRNSYRPDGLSFSMRRLKRGARFGLPRIRMHNTSATHGRERGYARLSEMRARAWPRK